MLSQSWLYPNLRRALTAWTDVRHYYYGYYYRYCRVILHSIQTYYYYYHYCHYRVVCAVLDQNVASGLQLSLQVYTDKRVISLVGLISSPGGEV